MEKIKTTVRIAGKDYTIVGSDSEAHIHRIATYVDRRMSELSMATRMPPDMVSVLVAMNMADELIKAQDENSRLRRELLAKSQHGSPVKSSAN